MSVNRPLTAKQEHFAQLVASGETQACAYLEAYDVGSYTSSNTVYQNASSLREHTQVSLRIKELLAASEAIMMEKRALTAENLVDEAFINLEGARRDKQWGSANGAVEWIGRATGLVSDKVQPGAVAVTKIIINLAPGVEPPTEVEREDPHGVQIMSEVVEATEYHEIENQE